MWAAVPLKSPETAKSRLGERLDAASRRRLFLAMAQHTIRALARTPGIDGVSVVTASAEVAALAARHGATVILERTDAGMVEACRTAVAHLSGQVRSLLLVSGDLPLVTERALAGLTELRGRVPLVAIAPDRHGRGTNALLCSPPEVIPVQFGADSFERHCAAARERGVEPNIVRSEALALDIDLPADLDQLERHLRANPGCLPDELLACIASADAMATS